MTTHKKTKTPQMPLRCRGAIGAARSRNRRNAFARGDIAGFFTKHGVPPALADEVVDQLSESASRRLAQSCRAAFQTRATATEIQAQAQRADLTERTREALGLLPQFAAAELAELLSVVTWTNDGESEAPET